MPIERAGIVYYTLNEVADYVERDRSTVYRWKKKGKIPAGLRYRDRELLFTLQQVEAVYAYAHRVSQDEAAEALRDQLHLPL